MMDAGLTIETKAVNDGNVIHLPKYSGMHALRHFYVSWCINRKEDGGLALPPKSVQKRIGHSSITLTMDVYGHLFPRADDFDEMAAAENTLFG
jgi:integrase